MRGVEGLAALGWDSLWAKTFGVFERKGWIPGRVVREEKALYGVNPGLGELRGRISGAFRKKAKSSSDYPKVGDWVAIAPRLDENSATIHGVVPRRNILSRKEPWVQTAEQTIAVNLDGLFIVMGLDQDFNIRRLERYLTTAHENGVEAVLVLNKADLCPDAGPFLVRAGAAAPGLPVCVASAVGGTGLDEIKKRLNPGKTSAFVGSTGVGKSSLINRLLGIDRMGVGDLREDGSGSHTTTRREMVPLPGGGWVMDTPGLRELQLWGEEDGGVMRQFADIAALSEDCRFQDCRHEGEPECAVRSHFEGGGLDQGRYLSYLKLLKELRQLTAQRTVRQRQEAKSPRRSRSEDSQTGGGKSWRALDKD